MSTNEIKQSSNQMDEQVSLIGSTLNSHLFIPKKDMNVEIETQLTRKLLQVGVWVVTSVMAIVIGSVITILWTLNGKVNELSGKVTSPDNVILFIGTRLDSLEKENKTLNQKIQQREIEELKEEIEKLTIKKNSHGY